MATPMFAAFRAGASFTPSPVMATSSPLALSARTSLSFCSGTIRAKMLHRPMRSSRTRVAHGLEFRAGDHRVRRLEADLPGDGPRRSRVVARDHDHPDAGRPALLQRLGHRGAGRVGEPHQPQEGEVEIVLRRGPFFPAEDGPGHTQYPQAVVGHGLDGAGQLRGVARRRDGTGRLWPRGRPLAAMTWASPSDRPPHVGHGEQFPGQRILVDDPPVVVKVAGAGEVRRPEIPERLLHGVERIDLAGQDPVFHELVEGLERGGVKGDASRIRRSPRRNGRRQRAGRWSSGSASGCRSCRRRGRWPSRATPRPGSCG